MPYSSEARSRPRRTPNVAAAEAFGESLLFEIEAIATHANAGGVIEGRNADAFVARVLELYATLSRLDEQLEPRERRAVIEHHRALLQPRFLAVPMVRHSVERPLGYPGDYQIVEMIFGAGPHADHSATEERIKSRRSMNVPSMQSPPL